MKWKEPTFDDTSVIKVLAAANGRRKADEYDYEEEQKEMNLTYPDWAKEWVKKYKEAWYIAEANGDIIAMQKAKKLADALRDKLRQMTTIPEWAQQQMQKQTLRWMEANEVGNVRVMRFASEAEQGIIDKLKMIESMKEKWPDDAKTLNELTAKWYYVDDNEFIPYEDREKYASPESAKAEYTKQAQEIIAKLEKPKQEEKKEVPTRTQGTGTGKVTGVPMPDSYAAGINALKAAHPDWSFEFYDAGLSLSEMIMYHHNSDNLTNDPRWIDQSDPKIYESGGWRKASEYGLKQNIDPNSNDSFNNKDIFQYMDLGANSSETIDGVKNILAGTSLALYAQDFYDAAKKYNLSAYYLCASAIVESAGGTSELATGVIVNEETVYNYFGAGANTGNAVVKGSQYAYNNSGDWAPWNSPKKAIFGGAEFVYKGYINVGQDTIYTMKYNLPGYINSKNKSSFFNAPHEYAANIGKPWQESQKIAKIFSENSVPLTFKIPVYR
ncbi:N-acetylglucosaminidase [Paenibacillus tyrfis]|uniref:N-acetylglucosaminidase n=1 Tax=Paenibacillus tyrfis TaxID=1501230 RepID=UPI0020A02128|nr:glucosaminidase domain-containing protein [Paenibacillus tyrfis]MCP1311453.1 glucosaminidase domain-containing protein [Paenibacillus tyrfis]